MRVEGPIPARSGLARGVALLEVLVALALCSVGLIGAGALVLQQMAFQQALEHDQFARDQLHDMARFLRTAMVTARADEPPASVTEALRAWQAIVATRLPGGQAAIWRVQGAEPAAWRLEIRWHTARSIPGSGSTLQQREGLVLP